MKKLKCSLHLPGVRINVHKATNFLLLSLKLHTNKVSKHQTNKTGKLKLYNTVYKPCCLQTRQVLRVGETSVKEKRNSSLGNNGQNTNQLTKSNQRSTSLTKFTSKYVRSSLTTMSLHFTRKLDRCD